MTEQMARTMGTTGETFTVSAVGLGCNNFGRKGSATEDFSGTQAVLGACLDHGITLLDTAALYGGPESLSEEMMGRALQGHRDEVIIATKFAHPHEPLAQSPDAPARGSRAYVRRAVEGSLRRLRTDYIDLFQMHEPDPSTPIEETLAALTELVAEGKVRCVGSSNFSAGQVDEAADVAASQGLVGFVAEQSEYSLLHREPEHELFGVLEARGIGFLPYFPLASGLLTGKYRQHEPAAPGTRMSTKTALLAAVTDAQWSAIERFRELCDARGVTMTEGTFAWLLSRPRVTSVIAGATRPQQVAANVAAGAVALDAETLQRIDEIFSDAG